jgi:hypothetical protein
MREVHDPNLGWGAEYCEVIRFFPYFIQANVWIMGWTTEGPEFGSRQGQKFSPHRPDRLWGPPKLLSKSIPGDICPFLKRPGGEADDFTSS